MEAKTSQLQIRVSPAEKATLKRLAASAEMSVSAFVLQRALSGADQELARLLRALEGGKQLHNTLSDLTFHLSGLTDVEFESSVAEVELHGLTALQQNCGAASVEGEAWRRRLAVPGWVLEVPPLPRPYFSWTLRSLRPHLMHITPASFKRRNVFHPAPDDPRR